MWGHLLKVVLVLLFSPCLLGLGLAAYAGAHHAARQWWGIDMGNSRWMAVGPMLEPRDFPEAYYVGDHSAFFTRQGQSGSTSLWRVSRHGVRLQSYFNGALSNLGSAGGAWFGVLARKAPDAAEQEFHVIIRSLDEGSFWEERGVLPEWGRLLAVSAREVWSLGRTLSVSTDGGQTFSSVALPKGPRLTPRRLAPGPDGGVWVLCEEGLVRFSDQGRTWSYELLPGAELQAAQGGLLVARVGALLALRRDAPGEDWRPFTDQLHSVEDFAVSGDTVRVLTSPVDPFKQGNSVWYHHSEDGGRTWTHENTLLAGRSVALHGLEWGMGDDGWGRVFGHVPGGMFTSSTGI